MGDRVSVITFEVLGVIPYSLILQLNIGFLTVKKLSKKEWEKYDSTN